MRPRPDVPDSRVPRLADASSELSRNSRRRDPTRSWSEPQAEPRPALRTGSSARWYLMWRVLVGGRGIIMILVRFSAFLRSGSSM